MKTNPVLLSALTAGVTVVSFCTSTAMAVPDLQLDILGGVYNNATETIDATDDQFTLYALAKNSVVNIPSAKFYIAAAVTPKVGPAPANLGSIEIDGVTYNVTSDMLYGTPPQDPGNLPPHGIYETYYLEVPVNFQLNAAHSSGIYNTQDDPGQGPIVGGTGLYFDEFDIDTSNLTDGVAIHFDFYYTYKKNGQTKLGGFAPFSHDAQSLSDHTPDEPPPPQPQVAMPEPVSFVLAMMGLSSLALRRHRRI